MRPGALVYLFFAASLLGQSPLQRAVELTRDGKYAEARKTLERASEPVLPAEKIAYHRLRAAISAGLHETETAKREMETALAIAPHNSNLLLAAAAAEMQNGNFKIALDHAQASDPTAQREALIGDIEEGLGATPAAIGAYERAITMAHGEERYRIALALDRIKHQQFETAAAELAVARREFPKSAKIATLLGIAEYAAGYSDEAVTALNEAIDDDPASHAAEPALAKIVLQASAPGSTRTLRQLCAWNQTVCDALELRVARESGDKGLLAKVTAALERGPVHDPVRTCELARAYEWEQRMVDARRELEACVAIDGTPQNHYRLGLLYNRVGEPELAKREMARRAELLKTMSDETALASSTVLSPAWNAH